MELRGIEPRLEVVEALELFHDDMQAANTEAAPDTVAPRRHPEARAGEGQLRARLKPGSWNVFVLAAGRRSS